MPENTPQDLLVQFARRLEAIERQLAELRGVYPEDDDLPTPAMRRVPALCELIPTQPAQDVHGRILVDLN